MAEAAPGKDEEFRSTNQTAFVVGHTGGTGLALVQELADRNIFQKVVLIGRRKLDIYEGEKYSKLEQKIVDFDKLEDYADEFSHSVGFSCLGAPGPGTPKEIYQKANHDYIVKVAELAKAGGCSHFLLVSAMSPDKTSIQMHRRLKGEVEAECTDLGFQRLSIFRPCLILIKRERPRIVERLAKVVFAPVFYFKRTTYSIPAETIGKAMVNTVVEPCTEPVETFENKDMYRVAEGKWYAE